MEIVAGLLILLLVSFLVLGLVAFIMCLVAFSRLRNLEQKVRWLQEAPIRREKGAAEMKAEAPVLPQKPVVSELIPPPPPPAEAVSKVREEVPLSAREIKPRVEGVTEEEKSSILTNGWAGVAKTLKTAETMGLEQRIGTKWVLVAGVIAMLVGIGFFLKFAYDRNWIGPLGRVVIAAIVGLSALGVGEWTRRRDYGIAARGLTALGFAILYVTIFGAYNFYHLLGAGPAFLLSILITTAAMLYAVSLNEILAAFLALLGGYLSPVLLSTGENRPLGLFSYVTLLSAGGMLCAIFRKWRAVNILAFLGTYGLYTGWFEKFYRPMMKDTGFIPRADLDIVLGWLGVFFVLFLVLPVLYELVRRVKAKREDVCLILSNAALVFYYLCTVLYGHYREALAFAALGMCAAHLVLMAVIGRRCRQDVPLRLSLLAISIFFVTVAIPLYLKLYAVAWAWAAEGILLTIIGLKYRSLWTRAGGMAAFTLSCIWLIYYLPLHQAAFVLVVNRPFLSWWVTAAAVGIVQGMYRRDRTLGEESRMLAEILYAGMLLLFFAGLAMEWFCHVRYNLATTERSYPGHFEKGLVVLVTVFMLLFLVRPLRPAGWVNKLIALLIGLIGSVYLLICFTGFHFQKFAIFANGSFGIGLYFVLGLLAGGWVLKKQAAGAGDRVLALSLGLCSIVVLWLLLTEEIYYYWHYQGAGSGEESRYAFLGQMYLSVMWAIYSLVLMMLGFWRKVPILRYIALGLLAVVLFKVFVFDMSTLKSVYRIAGFVVLGMILLGISYLYQFGKKKGFFSRL